MIEPLSQIDVRFASDDQIITAYMADGEDEAGARVYLAHLRGRLPVGSLAAG